MTNEPRVRELQAEYKALHEEVLEAIANGTLKKNSDAERRLQTREEEIVRALHRLGARPYPEEGSRA